MKSSIPRNITTMSPTALIDAMSKALDIKVDPDNTNHYRNLFKAVLCGKHYSDALTEISQFTKSPEYEVMSIQERLHALFQSEGLHNHLAKRDIYLALESILKERVSVPDQAAELNKTNEALVAQACLALGVNPQEAASKLPVALSQLSTSLRILKGFTGNLDTPKVPETPTFPEEPLQMLEFTNVTGLYQVTKKWYDWFWDIYERAGNSSKIPQRKHALTKAITERVHVFVKGSPEVFPAGMNLIVSYPGSEGTMSIPTVTLVFPADSILIKQGAKNEQ